MPTVRKVLDNVETATRNTENKMNGVSGNIARLPNIESKVNSINNYLPQIATGNQANQQAILIGGVSNQGNNIYADTQAIRNNDIPKLATGNQLNQQAILIGGVATTANNIKTDTQFIKDELPKTATGNQVNTLSNAVDAGRNESKAIPRNTYNSQLDSIQLGVSGIPTFTYHSWLDSIESKLSTVPTYNAAAGIAQLIGGQANQATGNQLNQQAILIGGVSTQGNNIYADTQAIRNNDIPKLATGNQANALSTSIANTNNSLANIQSGVTNIQATDNSILTNTNNLPRATYNDSFDGVNAKLDSISAQISGISSSSGSTAITRNYVSTTPELDLLDVIGAFGVGYVNPSPNKIILSASSVGFGNVNNFTNRGDEDFYTTNVANSWIRIDAGADGGRKINLTGLGFKSRTANANNFPLSLVIEGNDSGTVFTPIFTWNNIGFTATNQWKYTTFPNDIFYKFIRIRQPGVESSGTNFLTGNEIRLYGTITNS